MGWFRSSEVLLWVSLEVVMSLWVSSEVVLFTLGYYRKVSFGQARLDKERQSYVKC